jgi:hypothetical protein
MLSRGRTMYEMFNASLHTATSRRGLLVPPFEGVLGRTIRGRTPDHRRAE